MAPAGVRALLDGQKPANPRDRGLLPHTGLVDDPEIRAFLSHLAANYDPAPGSGLPPNVEETRLYRLMLEKASTATVSRAIHEGDAQTQSFVVGDPSQSSDISGITAIEKLKEMLTTAAPIVYIFGPPGAGKTNFGLLVAQLWKYEHPQGELASNIRTWQEADEWLPSYGQLDGWLSENTRSIEGGGITRREGSNPRLFVFDEASSHASGRGKSGYEAGEKLGPLVYKIRKANAGLVIIGHDGKDVHPAVRTLATVVKKKRQERKQATIYEDVRDRQGVNRLLGLTGIPRTDYTYDDGEATSWSWETVEESDARELTEDDVTALVEEGEEDVARRLAHRMATAVDDGTLEMTQAEIGRVIGQAWQGEPLAQTWVSKWKGRIEKQRSAWDDRDDGGEP